MHNNVDFAPNLLCFSVISFHLRKNVEIPMFFLCFHYLFGFVLDFPSHHHTIPTCHPISQRNVRERCCCFQNCRIASSRNSIRPELESNFFPLRIRSKFRNKKQTKKTIETSRNRSYSLWTQNLYRNFTQSRLK